MKHPVYLQLIAPNPQPYPKRPDNVPEAPELVERLAEVLLTEAIFNDRRKKIASVYANFMKIHRLIYTPEMMMDICSWAMIEAMIATGKLYQERP